METKTPWIYAYGDISPKLQYPNTTISAQVENVANENPSLIALSFMGRNIKYKELIENIKNTAKAFASYGIGKGDCVTLCMPNIPQCVYSLYALNMVGAIVSVIHPLSAEGEILHYLKETESRYVVTLDMFAQKVIKVKDKFDIYKIIVADIADELSTIKSIAYKLMSKVEKPDYTKDIISWKQFIDNGKNYQGEYRFETDKDDTSVILFSGGTTGVTKGIELSSHNFNALAYQTGAMSHCNIKGKSMLAAMPMFHGFGLGVCIHTMLALGGRSILVPKFNSKEYSKLIKTQKPNFIAGVPTLFEAIVNSSYLDGVNLSCLKGVFSGGDTLSPHLKKKIDKFLEDHGASVHVREGYGMTECVTASCLTPYFNEKEGSIGIPFPDTYYKICQLGTNQEMEYGQLGEICISGPTVMKGYLNHKEETENTLELHDDGKLWLRSGDLGYMDDEGFVYFKQRLKRMIITSGYNVYPSHIEEIINGHPSVLLSCVIGVPDTYKIQKVKAFVVLNDGYEESDAIKEDIFNYCKGQIAKYAMPYDIEFRKSLPQTKLGKVAYADLEKEEREKVCL